MLCNILKGLKLDAKFTHFYKIVLLLQNKFLMYSLPLRFNYFRMPIILLLENGQFQTLLKPIKGSYDNGQIR